MPVLRGAGGASSSCSNDLSSSRGSARARALVRDLQDSDDIATVTHTRKTSGVLVKPGTTGNLEKETGGAALAGLAQ